MLNNIVSTVVVLALCAWLAACRDSGDGSAGHVGAILLEYTEQDEGTEPYPVRILVTPAYLRIDDGYDDSDYTLLDRGAGTIFSINHEARKILRIDPPAPGTAPVPDLKPGVEYLEDRSAPLIAGKLPRHYRFTAAGEVCREAVVVPELLPAAVQALSEYYTHLARQQVDTLDQVPPEYRTPCYMARYVYYPVRPLELGLPIREWDASGNLRALTNYRESVRVTPDLFVLPIGYEEQALTQ